MSRSKHLIYFTLGNNPLYINIAKLCIDSLNAQEYDGDVLFITDMAETIKRNIVFKSQPYFLETNKSDLSFSSANKLKIFLFDQILEYEKIIFCDLDVIWTNHPDRIFDLVTDNKIHMSNELVDCSTPKHLISSSYFGGDILTDQEKDIINSKMIYGLNAGFFAFNTNMISHFKNIYDHIIINPQVMNSCLEQPMINVYLYRNDLYSNALNTEVCHEGYNLNRYYGTALHFAGGPGNYQQKIASMTNFFNTIYNS